MKNPKESRQKNERCIFIGNRDEFDMDAFCGRASRKKYVKVKDRKNEETMDKQ